MIKKCKLCQKDFITFTHLRQYCTKNCKKEARHNTHIKYRQTHKEEIQMKRELNKDYYKNWYKKNRIKILRKQKKYSKEYRKNNKEKIRYSQRKWEQEHEKEIIQKRRINKQKKALYDKNRRSRTRKLRKIFFKNPVNRLIHNARTRVRNALKGICKSDHTIKLIGCSVEVLKFHLEKQFKEGMSWENYGYYGWHVDHIKPCNSFNLHKKSEQFKCFNYKNLQPLWCWENYAKNRKERIKIKVNNEKNS
jgi:hypothetical protein